MSSIPLEALGWAGSILLLWSMTRTDFKRLRQLNLAACIALTVYNGLAHVWPMAVLNLCLCGVNVVHLLRDFRRNSVKEPADESAEALARLTGIERHDVVVVLGSGWGDVADQIGTTIAEFPTAELPHFPPPSVLGHAGTVRSIDSHGIRVLAFLGRNHLYENLGVEPVTHAIRTAAASGCTTAILTNGCGSLHPSWQPGTAVLIRDHINLTAISPLEGAQFVDLSDLYSARLRGMCQQLDPALPEGVYVQFRGPQYETPAEIHMARALGGDLVGMSTTVEAIAARSLGLEVLGISLVTNLAAGVTDQPLDHEEVLFAGRASTPRLGALLGGVVECLATGKAPSAA